MAVAGVVILYKKTMQTKKETIDAILLKEPTGILTGLYVISLLEPCSILIMGLVVGFIVVSFFLCHAEGF